MVFVRNIFALLLLVGWLVGGLTVAYAQHTNVPLALSAKVEGGDEDMSITLIFDRKVDMVPQLLNHPWRLVLDFERLGFGFEIDQKDWSGFASDMRWGDMSDVNSRIIFEMDKPFRIAEIKAQENKGNDTFSLVLSLKQSDSDTFNAAMIDNMRTNAVVQRDTKSDRLGVSAKPVVSKKFTVVLDPGHGGIDSGAVGRHQTLEKEIVLAFAKELKARFDAEGNVEAILTRDSDVFIPLNDRVQFARQSNADLFISIHADSIRENYVRGATVYTISDKASDNVAASIAESENRADEIGGINFADEPEDVADILVDLARRETLGFSVQFARLAVSKLQEETKMINNPHRHAGFRVLRAPDVPSVLIELGYLSNAEDEKQLTQASWRAKIVNQIAESVSRFAELSGRRLSVANEKE